MLVYALRNVKCHLNHSLNKVNIGRGHSPRGGASSLVHEFLWCVEDLASVTVAFFGKQPVSGHASKFFLYHAEN